jgi:hypothetical protein
MSADNQRRNQTPIESEQRIPSASEVLALEQRVALQSGEQHPDILQLLADLIEGFPSTFKCLDRADLQRPANEATLLMFGTKAFFSLRSAKDLLLAGRYAQAQVLNRLLLEECMLGKYYLSHPDEAAEYLEWKDTRTPGMGDVLKELQLQHLKQDYDVLSEHAHSRPFSTYLSAVSHVQSSGWTLRSAPEYSEDLFLDCVAYSLKYAGEMLQLLVQQCDDLALAQDTRVLVQRVKAFLDDIDKRFAACPPATPLGAQPADAK